MKRHLGSTLLVLSLAACGDQPAPEAAVKPVPQPQVAAPAAAPALIPAAATPATPLPAAAPEPKADPDKELAARVKHVLEDEARIQAAGIDVTASRGTVTLWGTTASTDERIRAARAAYRVQGVTTVDNKLAVVKGS